MLDIGEEWKCILKALVAAPVAWQSPVELAATLGRGVEETTDVLSLMDAANWLSVWDVEPGPVVTLSALAAHRLKVVLVEVGPGETPRWAPANEPIPSVPKASNVSASEYFACQDKLLDSQPSPEQATEDFESRSVRANYLRTRPSRPFRVEDLPLPTLLLGDSLTPWPGPKEFKQAAECPACGGGPLSPHAYCLGCDRWGLDTALEKLSPKRAPARPRRSRSSRSWTEDGPTVSVEGRSGTRAPRSDDHRPCQDELSRKGDRCLEGSHVHRSAPVAPR
jgi:hypothetical protein